MGRYDELKQKAWEANMALPKHGLVFFTFGNASAMDRNEGIFAIKPSGVPYDVLRPEDMVVVDLDNKTVEGSLRFSSDTKTHSMLYRHFPEIGGVVHTHSTYCTAWAQAVKPIPILGTTHADHAAGDIPCTEVMADAAVKRDYEEETGLQILRVFKNRPYLETEMVLVACHGPFTWGRTPEKAVYNSVVMEELAKMALLTRRIRPNAPRLKRTLIQKHYLRKHGRDATYGQENPPFKNNSGNAV
jgi:L-ribulose-5-phosphate 4-epimerase